MSEKKFPLNTNDVLDSFDGTKGSGFYGSILIERPIERISIGGAGSAVACVPSGPREIELKGNLDWFIHGLKNIVDKCNEAQQTQPTEQEIDELADKVIETMPDGIRGFCRTWGWQQFARALLAEFRGVDSQSSISDAKDQEIADLKRQLAAAQNDIKQLRQSRDKRNGNSFRVVGAIADDKRNKSASIVAYPKGVWIDWHGGDTAPIPDGVPHKVKLRCGTVSNEDCMASTWAWSHGHGDAEIIAFMIL